MAEHGLRAWFQLYGGLACALAVMVGGALTVAFDAPQPLRAIAAGGMALWAPGFVFTVALLAPGRIGGVERSLLALATSIALMVIPAILLDAFGVRLDAATFLVSGCVITSLAAVPALLSLRSLAELGARPRWRVPPIAAATAIGVALILAWSVGVARLTPKPAGIQGTSVLAATSAGPRSIKAEVISAELDPTRYRITMLTRAGRIELNSFTLAPGASWRRSLRRLGEDEAVELILYRGAERQPYRRVVVAPA